MSKQTKDNKNYSGLQELLNLEEIKNYNSSIVKISMNNVNNPKNVIDFGAGIGTLALIFREKFNISPVCIEIDEDNIDYLKKRKFEFFRNLKSAPTENDLIFSSNVLEHIKDDQNTLNLMKKKLKKNGILFLYLPAKMLLWSGMDEAVGHYRRYEFREIKMKCEKAGFDIKQIHYADSIGFFASLAIKFFGYNTNNGLGSKKSIKFYDKYIFPISKSLDKLGFKHFIGKNLLIIAKKTT